MYIDRFPGVQTMLKWTGYGGCQAIPSTYFMDLFDRDADKRWSDLHQWVWYYNDPADDRNDMFDADGIPQDRWTFIGMTKFYDHTRPGNMSKLSDRSYPVIRLGELYLIRAEARIRSTENRDLKGAAEDITQLRKRAVNHEKPEYEEAMKVTEEDMTLDFILEERARELFGEWQRRLDLKRFGRLIDQVRIYNPDAKDNIKEYHVVRPIPQTQFDGMPDWTTLGQNEGY